MRKNQLFPLLIVIIVVLTVAGLGTKDHLHAMEIAQLTGENTRLAHLAAELSATITESQGAQCERLFDGLESRITEYSTCAEWSNGSCPESPSDNTECLRNLIDQSLDLIAMHPGLPDMHIIMIDSLNTDSGEVIPTPLIYLNGNEQTGQEYTMFGLIAEVGLICNRSIAPEGLAHLLSAWHTINPPLTRGDPQ